MRFREIEITNEMLEWSKKASEGFIYDKHTHHEIDLKPAILAGRVAEAVHQKLHPDQRRVDENGFDFVWERMRIEVASSRISMDPNHLRNGTQLCLLTDRLHDLLLRSDVLVWYSVAYDNKKAWALGWADSADVLLAAYRVEKGMPGKRPKFNYPFSGYEFDASILTPMPMVYRFYRFETQKENRPT